jgi:anti-anti-sigma factor
MGLVGMLIERHGKWLRVALAGEIDLAWYATHADEIDVALADCPPVVVVDLEQVDFLDSTGLSLLARAYRECQHIGGRVYVLHPSQSVTRAIRIGGFSSLVTIVTSCEHARSLYGELARLDVKEPARTDHLTPRPM